MTYATAGEASAAFYRAFATGDLEVMGQLWLDDAAACCVHPARDAVVGREAVMDSWREILAEAGSFDIAFQPGTRLDGGDLVVEVGIERLTMNSGQVALLTVTNAYQRTPGGWRMVLHHAAPVQHVAEPSTTAVH